MDLPELYMIRHGLTEWNSIDRYQGQKNSPLTETGRAQAAAVGRRLAEAVPRAAALPFFCSPLGRCRETAALICRVVGLDPDRIRFDDRLMERCYGHWEGHTYTEVDNRFADERAARRKDPWNYLIPGGGENFPMLQARVDAWLAEQPTTTPAIVVSHGMLGKVFRARYRDLDAAALLALDEPQGVIIHLRDGEETILEGLAG